MQAPVSVVPYDPAWPGDFALIADFVLPVLPPGVQIEHVGSTSVPGLAAKPIIDLDLVVVAEMQVEETIRALALVGFEHRSDGGIPGRQAFNTLDGLPYHHLYVVIEGNDAHREHIDLRDYLRTHPEQGLRYVAEKRRLEHLLVTDRQAYVTGKGPVIQDLLRQARSGPRGAHHAR